jgi:hypothetical protein
VAALADHHPLTSVHKTQGTTRGHLLVEVRGEQRASPHRAADDDREVAENAGYSDAYGRATDYTPSDDDAYIHDRPSGAYDACMGERFLGSFDRRWQAEHAISGEMQRSRFFPNVWLQDDHGGLTLLDATEADFGRDPECVLHTHVVATNLGLEGRDEFDLKVEL